MKWAHRGTGWVLTMAVFLLFLSASHLWADEWGEWDDLPDNLLESQNDVRSLEELSLQLDQLIAESAGASGTAQERLLERWLNQLAPHERESLSLDTLLSLPEDWTDDQFEAWYESLDDDSGTGTLIDDDDFDEDDELEDDDDLDDDDMEEDDEVD